MSDHTQLPAPVSALFQGKDPQHRRVSSPVGWSRKAWSRLSGHEDLLGRLDARIGADQVVEYAARIQDATTALDAFVVTMVWGHGRSGYGPFRTARVIDENGGAVPVGEELLRIAQIATERGGLAAFGYIADRRKDDRGYLKHLGPAFGTKFIYFCTRAGRQSNPDLPISPILDAVIARWFETNMPEHQLKIWWWDVESYQSYIQLLADWAQALGVPVDAVEQAIFRAGDPDERSGDGTGIADRRSPDPDSALAQLTAAFTGLGDATALERARPHLDALREVIRTLGSSEDGAH